MQMRMMTTTDTITINTDGSSWIQNRRGIVTPSCPDRACSEGQSRLSSLDPESVRAAARQLLQSGAWR